MTIRWTAPLLLSLVLATASTIMLAWLFVGAWLVSASLG